MGSWCVHGVHRLWEWEDIRLNSTLGAVLSWYHTEAVWCLWASISSLVDWMLHYLLYLPRRGRRFGPSWRKNFRAGRTSFWVPVIDRFSGRMTCKQCSQAHDFEIPWVGDAGLGSDAVPHTPASFKTSVNICCWPVRHSKIGEALRSNDTWITSSLPPGESLPRSWEGSTDILEMTSQQKEES